MPRALLIAAPASGSGKTTVTLGILRALARRGVAVSSAKSGPDYIDPRFHEAASGAPCVNLDAWAMTPERISALAGRSDDLLVIEGAMGLFDGAPHSSDPTRDGKGASADLARQLGAAVILVVDASHMAQSIAPLVAGFIAHDPALTIAGVIVNKVGSPRHAAMITRALGRVGVPLIGCILRDKALATPSRHLGLVQAGERPDLDAFLDRAADTVEDALDLDALTALATHFNGSSNTTRTPPPAQRIAVAQDAAFAFAYPHLLDDWHAQGAEIATFSPLDDQPAPPADLVYLPGGYPELHAGRIAANHRTLQSLREAAARGRVYGECGGYMVLGDGLVDRDGVRHRMAGLLDLETSFATRKLHLGYRTAMSVASGVPFAGTWTAHEFHYATTLKAEGTPLFTATDAEGTDLGPQGLVRGSVSGSFLHLIDKA